MMVTMDTVSNMTKSIHNIVGFTCSTFDLLHAGHIQMLREAKDHCDYLICGLQIDPSMDRADKNPPVQTIVERYVQLSAVQYVEDILNMYSIDVRIIGEEYKKKTFTGRAICSKRGIEVHYNKRDHRFSSSDLRLRVATRETENVSDTRMD